jgi:hypothetical protein
VEQQNSRSVEQTKPTPSNGLGQAKVCSTAVYCSPVPLLFFVDVPLNQLNLRQRCRQTGCAWAAFLFGRPQEKYRAASLLTQKCEFDLEDG